MTDSKATTTEGAKAPTPHSSLQKPEAKQVQAAEEQLLADAQTLATPDAQEELHSSQTKEADAQGKALKDTDLSTPADATKGEAL